MKAIVILFLTSFSLLAQSNNETINPKNKWFFGAEIGLNNISSHELAIPYNSFQGGIMAEYYYSKKWSVIGRIKYFETGLSFINQGSNGGYLGLGSTGNYGVFEGTVISVPIDFKKECYLKNNFYFNYKIGLAYNYETKSNYYFSSNFDTNNPKSFASLNLGIGFTYYVSNKMAIYLDFETYRLGGYKTNSGGWLWPKSYYTTNNLINIGVKYNFNFH